MTDNEIIKALEVCVGIHNDCDNCPLLEYSQATDECMTEAVSNALDLINRQKSEIERLQKLLDDKCDRCIAKDRAEAVKEFAERLKDKITMSPHSFISIDKWYIDNLVKEMVGENNG